MTHVLVTNDFPPKLGGIQSYLWELWRRLPPKDFAVLTIGHPRAREFDDSAPYRIQRLDLPMLLPTPKVRSAIQRLADETGASLVVLDPCLPLGMIGPSLDVPYALVLHGAEVTVPARLPGTRRLLGRALAGATLVISAGAYAAGEARRVARGRMPTTVIVPPGVDLERFHPLGPAERAAARRRLGLPDSASLVVSVSRLVPRKGMDVLIEASARIAPSHPHLMVAIGGAGRDGARLARLAAKTRAPVRFLGRVPDRDLPELDAVADVWAMLCRNRWGGLEQEGFGCVFLEAAASGVPQLAGRSGGADEAVVHGLTGLVADRPGDVVVVAESLARLLDDKALRERLGVASRARVVASFDYASLVERLRASLEAAGA